MSFWEKHGEAITLSLLTAVMFPILRDLLQKGLAQLEPLLEALRARIGIKFRRRYLEALGNKHKWLKLIGVFNSADLYPPRLNEVYISLRVTTSSGVDTPRLNWNEIFNRSNKLITILGGPGAGKSTLLDYLILIFTGSIQHPLRNTLGEPIPLFARLREFGGEHDSIERLIERSSPLKVHPKGFPENWLKQKKCIVFLDGLDEVLDENIHRIVTNDIQKFINEYSRNAHVVVTCRIAGWYNQLPAFRAYEIQPFSTEDIRRFIGAWYREVLRAKTINTLPPSPPKAAIKAAEEETLRDATIRTESLWDSLAAKDDLLRIAETPLLLSLITLVHFHRVTDLPKGRSALYSQCLQILLDIWDRQDKQLQVISSPTPEEKEMVLGSIAFGYLQEERLEANSDELTKMITPLLPRIKIPISAESFIRQIYERSGILLEHRLGFFGFTHRALHDYLAARYIIENELDGILLERSINERWREVILIAAALAPPHRADKLVKSLLSENEIVSSALEMAGLTISESVKVSAEIREEVKQKIASRLTQEEVIGPFSRLVSALIKADLEFAKNWLNQELRSNEPSRQAKIIELLPSLGEVYANSFIPILTEIISDRKMNADVRAQAVTAATEIVKSPDSNLWSALHICRDERNLRLRKVTAYAWCSFGKEEELGLIKIPAGEFLMGSDSGDSEEKPRHAVFLPTFFIGKYPIAAGDYRIFLAETGYDLRNSVFDDLKKEYLNEPFRWTNWYDVLAFCLWQGTNLPSESEWEKAARGTDGRTYPWGNSPASVMLQIYGDFDQSSPYGCAKMTETGGEWTRTLWGRDSRKPAYSYPYDPKDGRENLDLSRDLKRTSKGHSDRCSSRKGSPTTTYKYPLSARLVVSPSPPIALDFSELKVNSDLISQDPRYRLWQLDRSFR